MTYRHGIVVFVDDMALEEISYYDKLTRRNRMVQEVLYMVDELHSIVMWVAVVDLVIRMMPFGPYPVSVLYLSRRFYHLWMISVAVNKISMRSVKRNIFCV